MLNPFGSLVVMKFVAYLRLLSYQKVNLCHSLKSFADCNRFFFSIALYLAPSIFPSILIIFPVSAEGKKFLQHDDVTTMFCGVGMVCAVLGFYHMEHFAIRSIKSILVLSDYCTLFSKFAVSWLGANWTSYGFLHATLL